MQMLFSSKARKILFIVFAILASVVALYHLIGIFYKINESPAWRHAIFFLVNIICIYGFIKRPKYFILFLSVLLIQQYYSHGIYMVNMWVIQKKIHWISVLNLLILTLALICLVDNHRDNDK